MTSPAVNKPEITLTAGVRVYLMHNEKYFGVATVTIPGVYTMDEACSTKDHRVYYVKRYPMTRTYKGIPYDGWAVWSFDLV